MYWPCRAQHCAAAVHSEHERVINFEVGKVSSRECLTCCTTRGCVSGRSKEHVMICHDFFTRVCHE